MEEGHVANPEGRHVAPLEGRDGGLYSGTKLWLEAESNPRPPAYHHNTLTVSATTVVLTMKDLHIYLKSSDLEVCN